MGGKGVGRAQTCAGRAAKMLAMRWPCLKLLHLNRLQRIIRIMLNDLSFIIKVLAFLLPLRLYSYRVLVRFPASFAPEL